MGLGIGGVLFQYRQCAIAWTIDGTSSSDPCFNSCTLNIGHVPYDSKRNTNNEYQHFSLRFLLVAFTDENGNVLFFFIFII